MSVSAHAALCPVLSCADLQLTQCWLAGCKYYYNASFEMTCFSFIYSSQRSTITDAKQQLASWVSFFDNVSVIHLNCLLTVRNKMELKLLFVTTSHWIKTGEAALLSAVIFATVSTGSLPHSCSFLCQRWWSFCNFACCL